MATAADMMRGGMSAGQASAANGLVNSSVSAAGTTQGDATTLTSSVNVVTTAAAGSGVVLTNSEISDEYEILNIGANACWVYPPSSGQINNLAANKGFLLATNTAVKIKKFTATRWMGFLSA